MENVNPNRIKVEQNSKGTFIEIPAPKNGCAFIFLIPFLFVWAGGEIFALGMFLGILFGSYNPINKYSGDSDSLALGGFLLLWFIAWTGGGIQLTKTLAWLFSGKELIHLEEDKLHITKKTILYSHSKTFQLSKITNLSLVEIPPKHQENPLRVINQVGLLQFNYEGETIKFGATNSDQETKFVLDLLQEKNI